MIKIIERGNIFTIDGILNYAHGCNCAGAMGKGIALQFRNKFPEMYSQYKLLCKNLKFHPGDVFDYKYELGHIYNLGTQLSWKSKAKLEYIRLSVSRMCELAIKDNVTKIAMPTIGCGLGGLSWRDVKNEINLILHDYPTIDLYIVVHFFA